MDKKKDVPHSGVKEIIKQPAPSAVASNTDADDFNSSYIEFTPPLPSRYANAGRKSIEEMIKHAEEDRVQLKARDARLEKEKIEPDPDTWYGRFTVFRTVTLQQE